MAPKQVHRHAETPFRKRILQTLCKLGKCNRLFVKEISEHRLTQGVIHHAVKLVALQPTRRLVPDFTDNIRFRVNRLDAAAEFLPEAIVINFVRNIEAPAVNAALHPVLAHREKVIANIGIVGIELWERRVTPPAIVIGLARIRVERPAMHMEPVHIRGILAQLHQAVELEKSA